jgi:hypothetical protein
LEKVGDSCGRWLEPAVERTASDKDMAKNSETMLARLFAVLAMLEAADVEYYCDAVKEGYSLKIEHASRAIRGKAERLADSVKSYSWRGRGLKSRYQFVS